MRERLSKQAICTQLVCLGRSLSAVMLQRRLPRLLTRLPVQSWMVLGCQSKHVEAVCAIQHVVNVWSAGGG